MLTKCVNCGFYLRPDDDFCLNCGLKSPTTALPTQRLNLNLMIIISGLVSFLFILFSGLPVTTLLFITVFIVSLLSSALANALFNDWRIKRQMGRWEFDEPNSLKGKEKIIAERISELHAREGKINVVLDKIKQSDGRNLQEVRRKLLSAREIIASQTARYDIQKRKIEFVRLQNNVAPFLFNLRNLNEGETEKALHTIAATKIELDLLRRDLKKNIVADLIEMIIAPPKPFPEKESFLRQLKETENSCEKLREAVLSRQAALALEGISPLEEDLKSPGARQIAHAAETFNIQTALTDFSESFGELEHEYQRILTETEISRKLLET